MPQVRCSSLIPKYMPKTMPGGVLPVQDDRVLTDRDRREISLMAEAIDYAEVFESEDGTPDDRAWEKHCRRNGLPPMGHGIEKE